LDDLTQDCEESVLEITVRIYDINYEVEDHLMMESDEAGTESGSIEKSTVSLLGSSVSPNKGRLLEENRDKDLS